MKVEIMIKRGSQLCFPSVEEGIEWVTERRGVPGMLRFSVAEDAETEFSEGDTVVLRADGQTMFVGFVFRMVKSGDGFVKLTAYDQLRYLKNRDSYVFEAMKASERIRMIAQDFGLEMGEVADTDYVLPPHVEEDAALIDMMLDGLDTTLTATGRLYCLMDEAGKLVLRPAGEMLVGLLLDAESGEGYRWESSIDAQTSNRIKLVYEDAKTGARQVTIAQDLANMEKWGTLQHFERLTGGENARSKADLLLALYNEPSRSLKLSGMAGDMRLRAGCLTAVRLEKIGLNGLMLVEKCRHLFRDGAHTMDLELHK